MSEKLAFLLTLSIAVAWTQKSYTKQKWKCKNNVLSLIAGKVSHMDCIKKSMQLFLKTYKKEIIAIKTTKSLTM